MCLAAGRHDLDPDRISFTRSLRAARRSVRSQAGISSLQLTLGLALALSETCFELLPPRRMRAAARVVKRKMSNYGVKRAEHRDWPRPTRPPADAARVLAPP